MLAKLIIRKEVSPSGQKKGWGAAAHIGLISSAWYYRRYRTSRWQHKLIPSLRHKKALESTKKMQGNQKNQPPLFAQVSLQNLLYLIKQYYIIT